MMKITLSLSKSVQENANLYFEKAKKYKKKIEGARASVERLQAQLDTIEQKKEQLIKELEEKQRKKAVPRRELHWFEKFRWFRSSEGFLCIGGRDAGTNEAVVKKHADKGDLVFHTEAPGSPFFVVKAGGKDVGAQTIKETAEAAASYSRAWRMAISAVDAYHVNPDQLSKEPQSGEYLSKGAFVVRGKRHMMTAKLGLAVGITEDNLVMGGPLSAVKTHCKTTITIMLGEDRPSDAAKKIAKVLQVDVDDVLRVLPAGTIKVVQ